MKGIKFVGLIIGIVLTSIVMFGGSVLAAPAIVTSDPNLNFDSVKLQQTLTKISDKNSKLNVVFYSNNSLSSNKAVDLNDAFIGSIKSDNYVTLFYNKDSNNPNRGSFSVNVGANFRDYITKEEISANIVKPNIGKYLPQNPEEFIPVVAQEVVNTIEGKIAFNNNVRAFFVVVSIGLFFFLIYILIKGIIRRLDSNIQEHNKYKELVATVNTKYTNLVEQSTYLSGYEGATAKKCGYFLTSINDINDTYIALKEIPRLINIIFETSKWSSYTFNLSKLNGDLTALLEDINSFLKSIEGISGTDPLAEVIRLQELKDKQDKLDSLVTTFNIQYDEGKHFSSESLIHGLAAKLSACLNSNESLDSKIEFYNQALDYINREVILINNHHSLKKSIKQTADYILSNKNTYYTNVGGIDNSIREWAQELLTKADNDNKYYDSSKLNSIKTQLDSFAFDYRQQDAQYNSVTDRKNALIDKLTFTVPKSFLFSKNALSEKIRSITFKGDTFNNIEQKLESLTTEVNSFIKEVKQYNHNVNSLVSLVSGTVPSKYAETQANLLSKYNNIDPKVLDKNLESLLQEADSFAKMVNGYVLRHKKLSNYSGTRKDELTKQLDNNNYSVFDVLIVNYNNEDNRNTYSSSSSSSYNSDSSSYSSYSSSSSSSDDSNSWSSSSSSDSYDSSSSSDDSW